MSEGHAEHNAHEAGSAAQEVFVSYGSQDAGTANIVVDALEKQSLKCWIAPRDVTPGKFYAGAIIEAIDATKALVLILSANSASSPHVLREVERAASKRRPVISLRLDRSPLPADLEYFINASQWLDASNDLKSAIPKLISAVKIAMQSSGATPIGAPAPGTSAHARSRSRTLLVAAAAVGLAIVGLLAGRLWPSGHRAQSAPAATLAAPPPLQSAVASAAVADNSVAVLPFIDMSEKKNQEYFADGLSEEIIDRLSRVQRLRVIARTSSFYFKGRNDTIAVIGSTLHVSHVLEGSVRKSGPQLRITAQLVRTSDSSHVWSQTYERSMAEIFSIQTDIASQVAVALKLALSHELRSGPPTPNVDAYNQVLRAQYFNNRWQDGDLERAIAEYRDAVKLDPNYLDAWLGLGEAYASQSRDHDREASRQLALDAVRRGLAIDPTSARAHRVQGNIARDLQWDFPLAASEYDQAVVLAADRNESLRIQYEIEYLRAIRTGTYGKLYWPLLEEGARLNPLDARLLTEMAFYCIYGGQFQKGIDLLNHAYSFNPAGGNIGSALSYALLLDSQVAEARKVADSLGQVGVAKQVLTMIAWSEGNREESNRRLAELEHASRGEDAFTLAQIHAWRGERDDAFRCLDRAVRDRNPSVLTIRVDPILRRLQDDSRYQAIIQRLGLL